MLSIIIFILILSLLILVHELGHFIAAKKNGILVEEFGIGIPPRLFGIKIGETLYSINLLPFGGFNKLYGEEYQEMDNKKKADPKLKSRAFSYKKPWQKATVVLAGVIGNFLLGWLLISILFTNGVPVNTNKVIVEKVQKNSPAEKAGVKINDVIKKITKEKEYVLSSPEELVNLTNKFSGEEILITIERNNENISFKLRPRKDPPKGEGSLGIVITSYEIKKYPWYQAPFFGLVEAVNMTKQIASELLKILFQLITFQKTKTAGISGPIGIASYTSQVVKYGASAILQFTAILSLNLAVLNILPFPALDGGRLIFVIYEWVTKRKVNKKIEQYTNLAGMATLLLLLIIVTIFDIMKIYK